MKKYGIIFVLYLFVVLGWTNPNAPGELIGYYLYVKNLNTGESSKIRIEGDTTVQYEYTGEAANTHYIYRLSGIYVYELNEFETRQSDFVIHDGRTVKPEKEGVSY